MFKPGNVYRLTMSDNGSPNDIGTSTWEVREVNLPLVMFYQGVAKETRIVNTASIYFISATLVEENVDSSYWDTPALYLPGKPPLAKNPA